MSARRDEAIAELDAYRARKAEQSPDLFSVLDTALTNAGDTWTTAVLDAIRDVASRHAELTVEDLDGLIPPTHDKRAVGAVMLEAQRQGIIRKLGWVGSGRDRHGRPVRLWASLIYDPRVSDPPTPSSGGVNDAA